MSTPKRCILLAVGGTGGHLLPAQMAGRDLLEKNCRVVLAGKGLRESPVFDRKSFEFYEITSSSISQKNPVRLLRAFCLLCKGVWEALRLFSSLNPDVVVGFGSYHSFPLLLAARWKKIPTVIFQPDRSLGKVNHFFAKKARVVALQFPLEKNEFDHVAYVPLLPWNILQRTPSKEQAREQLGLKDFFTLLVFGGSQGAKFINEILRTAVVILQERKISFQVIHLTGECSANIATFYQKQSIPFYCKTFEKNMAPLFKAADLAICRAGASTCGELISFEVPYLLIPYPFAGGHQAKNAQYMQDEVKGGEMLLQESVTPQMLAERICQKKESLSYHKEKIKEFKKARASLRQKKLCDIICEAGGIVL